MPKITKESLGEIQSASLGDDNRSIVIVSKTKERAELKTVFEIPKKISLWQIGELNVIIADMLTECSGTGKIIAAALVTFLKTGDSKMFNAIFTGMMKAANGDLFEGAILGMGDLFKFLNTNRLTQIIAVLFLLPGETGFDEEEQKQEIKARQQIFRTLPGEVLWKGLKDFFVSKFEQLKNSNSLFKTFGIQRKEPSIENSETSTEILTTTEDSLTPSPMDTPNEKENSSG